MSGKTAGRALKAAISEGLLGSPSLFYEPGSPKHAALFYDLDEFEAGLDRAKDAFGKGIYDIYTSVCGKTVIEVLKMHFQAHGHGFSLYRPTLSWSITSWVSAKRGVGSGVGDSGSGSIFERKECCSKVLTAVL